MNRCALARWSLTLTALALATGCADNPVSRFLDTSGACFGGNPYRFALRGTPSLNVVQVANQPAQVTARIPMEVGRPCEALQGGSSSIQGLRVLRDGSPIASQGEFSAGVYTLRFSDLVAPRRYRYEIQAAADANPSSALLGRLNLDVDAASPIQGFPVLAVSAPNLPQPRLSWTPASGHSGYRLQFSYADPVQPSGKRTALMHLAPEVTSYRLGDPVVGDAVIEEGRTLVLPAEIADARGSSLRPGLTMTVTVGAFRFEPGQGADRLTSGTDWEHRSGPLSLAP